MSFRKWILAVVALVAVPAVAAAQISATYTFSSGQVISSSQINTNFALLANALNRTGGTITGNITVSAGITIDGIDLSAWLDQSVKTTGTPTFAGLTVSGTGASAFDVGGGINAGTGNVGIVDATGKIPAISSTYFASLTGVNLTGVALLGTANTYTAINNFLTYSETKTAPTIGGGALAFNLALGTQFAVALNGNATITISNPVTSGSGGSFLVLFTNDGTLRTLTWPASVKWAGGTAYAPSTTNLKVDAVQCIYNNGGGTYYCTSVLNF